PRVTHPAPACKGVAHLPAHPLLQVRFPRRIVRVGPPQYLLPPHDLDLARLHQPNRPSLALAVSDHPGENPLTASLALEVFLLDPPPALAAVALVVPPLEFPEDPVVHRREDAFAHSKTVVHGPALDLLIQTPDQVSRRHASRAVDRFLDLGQEPLDAPPRRLDQHFAVVTTLERLPKKIEAVLAMRDSGLLVGEFETPLGQELLHERLDFIRKENPGRAGDDEVIRI